MEIAELAKQIVAKCGEWTLGELGDQGLRDVVWDTYPDFWKLDKAEQDRIVAEVDAEIYG
jgi:hypothetical protein